MEASMYPVRIPIESRINFLHAELEDDNGLPVGFRYTAAYHVLAMEQEGANRDPCFVIDIGFAFCNELADPFSKPEGRMLAEERCWLPGAMRLRMYPGIGDIQFAIERAWTRKSYNELRDLHMPQRLARWIGRAPVRPDRPERSPLQMLQRTKRAERSRLSRNAYNDAIDQGMSRDEAVAMARSAVRPQ